MSRLLFVLISSIALLAPQLRAQTQPAVEPSTRPSGRVAAVIVLEGEVNDYTQAMLKRRLETAKKDYSADTVILVINTWGGAALSAIEISQLLKQQDDLHVVAFVQQKAISAGAMIAVACDEIVMMPGSMIGDCAPIVPGEQQEKTERAKSEGPILAEFADSAHRNGHDELLVQSMVTVDRVVHYIQNPAGERKFVDQRGYEDLVKNGDWRPVEGVPDPVDSENSLLTIHAEEALRLGLSHGTFNTVSEFAASRGLSVATTLDHSTGERLIGFLSSSGVRGILSIIFLLSLYASFNAPGHGAPEAICLGALGLLVGLPLMTGYATWVEIVMVVLGIALLATELFVIPGFGFVGITGIAMLFAGLVLTFMPTEPSLPGWLPSLSGTWTAMYRGILVLTIAMACSLALGAWLNKYLPSMPYFNRLVLNEVVGGGPDGNYSTVIDSIVWPEIGAVGRAVTDLRPGGTAAFADPVTQGLQTTAVVSDSGFVPVNTQIVVQEVHGNRVVVRPAETA